ncbi:MAG: c-type cytochrome [Limnohabitans sp.]|nr:c-type cytochrome [Limnohabitans sp.]
MKPINQFILGLGFALASVCALAQTNPTQVRSWAAGCANCHGTNGQAQPGMEALAGANKEDIIRKMADFKAGRRTATIMHQLAKGYSDDEIQAIAGYFASQKR